MALLIYDGMDKTNWKHSLLPMPFALFPTVFCATNAIGD